MLIPYDFIIQGSRKLMPRELIESEENSPIYFYLGQKHQKELRGYFKELDEKRVRYCLYTKSHDTWNPIFSYYGLRVAGIESIKDKLKVILDNL